VEDDLSDLPEACRNETPPLTRPEDVRERIAEIATKLAMESKCDREFGSTPPRPRWSRRTEVDRGLPERDQQ